MDRINKIMKHTTFVECMRDIETAELKRRFCCHGIEHSLDVARISYIMVLEEHIDLKKDVVYATALLHDLGRSDEYKGKDAHHVAGANLAKDILSDCDYLEQEISEICQAILSHKEEQTNKEHPLAQILYKADKLSRNCFACQMYEECYWLEDLKNKTIVI